MSIIAINSNAINVNGGLTESNPVRFIDMSDVKDDCE